MSLSRIAPGNLNLCLIVLSPDNKIVFQASLVTSESLTTRFTLPTAGTYTICVFRIDLLPPDSPQPTAFQVQATLSPQHLIGVASISDLVRAGGTKRDGILSNDLQL
jgi:hypothetical protein